MRTIERKINALVSLGLDGAKFDRKLSKRDQVVSDGQGTVEIYLWGTRVALLQSQVGKITVQTGGHESVTTKSRLNSILWQFAQGKPRISQKNFCWYSVMVDPLTSQQHCKEFESGVSYGLAR